MAFPTTPILDSGAGPDEDPISTNWSGPVYAGELQIRRLSNEFIGPAVALNGDSYYDITTYPGDVEAYATLKGTFNDGQQINILSRIQSPNTGSENVYFMRWIYSSAGADSITLRKKLLGGASTQLADISTDLSTDDVIGMSIIGTTITGYRNGVSLGSAVDGAIVGTGSIGMEFSGNSPSMRASNFGGGTPGGATAADDPPFRRQGRGAGW